MRRIALIALKFGISALLLYFATRRINFSMLGARLNRIDVGWLSLAIAVAVTQTLLAAIRWQRIAQICGAALQPRQAIRFTMIAAFFNQVLPSTVGGDAARMVLLARAGAGWWRAAYSVLLDRFVGVLALAALVTGGLTWSFALVADPTGRIVLALIGAGSLAGGVAFLLLGSLPWLSKWSLTQRLAEMSVLARRILFGERASVTIILLSLAIHALSAMIAWASARSVASALNYSDAFLLVLPVLLIATVPISIAGWGVRETALVLAFSYAGLPESDGLIVSVLFGGIMFAIGIVGGVIWLMSPEGGLKMPTGLNPPP